MKSTNIEIDSLDILQELFGINDKLIKVIENRLGVSITQRNSCITVSGTNDGRIHSAVNIIEAMKEALEKQQQLSVDMIHRFLDETEEEDDSEEDIADSTRKVLGDAVTLNYKNIPIRTKTIGQKNYITALKNNTVTICIGPAGTGKTYLAVAYAAELYRNDEIERIILSRPAIEAGEKLGFLPEAQNDMIFSIICEELGLFGAIAVLMMFILLIWRCMIIANNAPDLFGALLVVGVMGHIAIQVILNVAVVTNTIPNTGISLPFISYGGSSVMFLLAEIGIVFSVGRGIRLKDL